MLKNRIIGYKLDKNGQPKRVYSFLELANWLSRNNEKRRIGLTEVGKFTVSTVFLMYDHSCGFGKPVLFETMIFNTITGKFKAYQERYCTKKEAIKGHRKAIKMLKSKLKK